MQKIMRMCLVRPEALAIILRMCIGDDILADSLAKIMHMCNKI